MGQVKGTEQGQRLVIRLLFLRTLVHLAACSLLLKVCVLPHRCLAITVLMSFAQAATNPVECSQEVPGPPANA